MTIESTCELYINWYPGTGGFLILHIQLFSLFALGRILTYKQVRDALYRMRVKWGVPMHMGQGRYELDWLSGDIIGAIHERKVL